MSIKRNVNESRVKSALMEAAISWIDLNETAHEHLENGTLAPIRTSHNEFLRLAESAYYEAIRGITWEPEPEFPARYAKAFVDDVTVDCPDDGVPSLYAHYDAQESLLYVGMTLHARKRQMSHRRESRWWYEVSQIRFWTYPNELLLSRAETLAICDWRPKYNIQGNPRDLP